MVAICPGIISNQAEFPQPRSGRSACPCARRVGGLVARRGAGVSGKVGGIAVAAMAAPSAGSRRPAWSDSDRQLPETGAAAGRKSTCSRRRERAKETVPFLRTPLAAAAVRYGGTTEPRNAVSIARRQTGGEPFVPLRALRDACAVRLEMQAAEFFRSGTENCEFSTPRTPFSQIPSQPLHDRNRSFAFEPRAGFAVRCRGRFRSCAARLRDPCDPADGRTKRGVISGGGRASAAKRREARLAGAGTPASPESRQRRRLVSGEHDQGTLRVLPFSLSSGLRVASLADREPGSGPVSWPLRRRRVRPVAG